jgi:Flp pilus assembly protein TadG
VVELALGFTVLAVLAGGIIEVGRAVLVHHALTDGVGAAARYLTRVVDPCTAEARAAALNLLVTRRLDGARAPVFAAWPAPSQWNSAGAAGYRFVVVDCEGAATGSSGEARAVTVRASVRFDGIVGMLGLFGFADGLVVGAAHRERHIGL